MANGQAQDINNWVSQIFQAGFTFIPTTLVAGQNYTISSRVEYIDTDWASGGGDITINTPVTPTVGMTFTVRLGPDAGGLNDVILVPTGYTVEDPTHKGTFTNSLVMTTANADYTWCWNPNRNRYDSIVAPGSGTGVRPSIAPTVPPASSSFTHLNFSTDVFSSYSDGVINVQSPAKASVNRTMGYLSTSLSGSWTIVMGFIANLQDGNGTDDIGLAITDGTKILSVNIEVTGSGDTETNKLFVQYFTSPTTFSTNVVNLDTAHKFRMGTPLFLKIADDGTTRTFSISTTGRANSFIQYGSSLRSAQVGFTPTAYGPIWQSTAGNLNFDMFHLVKA